jgi:hypothetical protein
MLKKKCCCMSCADPTGILPFSSLLVTIPTGWEWKTTISPSGFVLSSPMAITITVANWNAGTPPHTGFGFGGYTGQTTLSDGTGLNVVLGFSLPSPTSKQCEWALKLITTCIGFNCGSHPGGFFVFNTSTGLWDGNVTNLDPRNPAYPIGDDAGVTQHVSVS